MFKFHWDEWGLGCWQFPHINRFLIVVGPLHITFDVDI